MAKMFVRAVQTYYKDIIMDVEPGESMESINARVARYAYEHRQEEVIDQGGEISVSFLGRPVLPGDEETYECID